MSAQAQEHGSSAAHYRVRPQPHGVAEAPAVHRLADLAEPLALASTSVSPPAHALGMRAVAERGGGRRGPTLARAARTVRSAARRRPSTSTGRRRVWSRRAAEDVELADGARPHAIRPAARRAGSNAGRVNQNIF
ncbi:MAG: hypothetical protein SF182_00460 [Deltaproteobacteria bacterium]|nr:hypothetical protein [Deltaproteobacteria bacterium]